MKSKRWGIKTFLPTLEQFNLRGKDKLQNIAEKIGLSLPETIIVTSLELLYKALEKLGFPVMVKGPFELECMVDLKNNKIYLIEINPRFPAWSYFASALGINIPSRIIRTANDLNVDKNMDYPSGYLYVRYTTETIVKMNKFQTITTAGEC